MKKAFNIILSAVLFAGIVSCEQPALVPEPTLDYAAGSSNDEILVKPEGETVSLKFSSSESWDATTVCDWLDLHSVAGKAGENNVLEVDVDLNSEFKTENRVGQIVIHCGKTELIYTIKQPLADYVEHFGQLQETLSLNPDGGEISLTFLATRQWTAVSDASWLTVDNGAGEAGAQNIITVSALENLDTDRTANVTVKVGNGTPLVYTFTQKKSEKTLFYISGESNEKAAYSTQCNVPFKFKALADWTATSDSDWAQLSATSGQAGEVVTMTVNTADNPTHEAKAAVVTVQSGNCELVFKLNKNSRIADFVGSWSISAQKVNGQSLVPYSEVWTIIENPEKPGEGVLSGYFGLNGEGQFATISYDLESESLLLHTGGVNYISILNFTGLGNMLVAPTYVAGQARLYDGLIPDMSFPIYCKMSEDHNALNLSALTLNQEQNGFVMTNQLVLELGVIAPIFEGDQLVGAGELKGLSGRMIVQSIIRNNE